LPFTQFIEFFITARGSFHAGRSHFAPIQMLPGRFQDYRLKSPKHCTVISVPQLVRLEQAGDETVYWTTCLWKKGKHKTAIKKNYSWKCLPQYETAPWRFPNFKTVHSLPSVIFTAKMHHSSSTPFLELHKTSVMGNNSLEICTGTGGPGRRMNR